MMVKEIMKSPVVTINEDATIKDCGELLEKHHINGMPVVDDGRVIGVITRADIFKSILPRHLLQMIERYPEISVTYPEVKEIFEKYPGMLGEKNTWTLAISKEELTG